ncbi:MAG: hypothetical protein N3E45_09245 [Oscillatoriaceae bacterium SKW80]|nr:hypothetical protein [Oscillatoriaceae bacterium SKYG93]MCX8120999.1 hypothetical protein [Oscillatoriaceae bacterium SKW80]MDW8452272.1 hypothetical protein [Oscillatoriaceae cyanobacterium SKYGB_i_bin93]HIK26607.1 hypothetical protein [Oscillatoriaceae cyanobacterium M7585_C2015_266]
MWRKHSSIVIAMTVAVVSIGAASYPAVANGLLKESITQVRDFITNQQSTQTLKPEQKQNCIPVPFPPFCI